MDFGAITRDPDAGVITFSAGPMPRRIAGIAQLVQSLIIELMADPRPELGRGSGFVTTLRTSSTDDVTGTSAALSRSLDLAKEHMLQSQSYDTGLKDSERLRDVSLRGLATDGQQWFADLDLVSVAGERFILPVS